MLKLVTRTLLASLLTLPAASAAVDLNGRWRFEIGITMIVPITQTGSVLSIPLQLPFTGTVGPADVNGFSNYQVSWTDGVNQAGFGGRVMPSGNLLDGRGGSFFPPGPPLVFGSVATRCTCFDGNSTNGDGCDAACQIEPCWTCSGDPSVCTPTADAGACDDGSPCTAGETCTAGVCDGGTPVTPCFDLNGPWSRHQVS
jgi:cysteine-rich repeat protein